MNLEVAMWGLWLSVSMGIAGNGPWTLEAGEHGLYLAGETHRYARFVGPDEVVPLTARIISAGGVAVWTFGMAYGLEGEVQARYESVRLTDLDTPLCQGDVPDDWCAPTWGVGDVAARIKWRIVDEAFGAPVSLGLFGGTRSGEAYANRRARITTLGDGTTDLGAGLSVGRTDRLGSSGWFRVSVDVAYWYRLALTRGEGRRLPADEITGELNLLVSPSPRLGLGPTLTGFHRLWGRSLQTAEADFFDGDYWSGLDAGQFRVGGKVGLFSAGGGPTVSISVLQTVTARNNPTDTLSMSLGIGWRLDGSRER